MPKLQATRGAQYLLVEEFVLTHQNWVVDSAEMYALAAEELRDIATKEKKLEEARLGIPGTGLVFPETVQVLHRGGALEGFLIFAFEDQVIGRREIIGLGEIHPQQAGDRNGFPPGGFGTIRSNDLALHTGAGNGHFGKLDGTRRKNQRLGGQGTGGSQQGAAGEERKKLHALGWGK